jgi:hypothetical protein
MTIKKPTLHEEIAAYAVEFAGTEFDLDEALEAASIEHLLSAVKQLSPDELREFTRKFDEWQNQPGKREKPNETSNQRSQVEAEQRAPFIGAKAEAVLIKATKERLPAVDEQRLKQLCQKSEHGTLTETDLEEYRTLAQQAEELDFRRTEALVKLVKLKGKSVYAVMKEIGWEEAPFE